MIYFGYSSAVCCDLRSAGGQRVYTALGAALSVPGVVYLLALPLVGVMRT